MKKIATILLVTALLAVFSVGVYADDTGTGSAALELLEGELLFIDVDDAEAMKGIDDAFAAIGSMSVDFGDHYITGNDETYESLDEDEEQIYVGAIVQDARGQGVNSTWYVTAQLDHFSLVGDQEENPTLAGSELTLTAVDGSLLPGNAPINSDKPEAKSVNLAPGAQSPSEVFVSATKANGGSPGVWGVNWIPTLWVPASAQVGEHTATLTWTLTASV